MPILNGKEKMNIERTGYYLETISFGQPDEQPGVFVNLRDPSGSIVERVVITAPVGDERMPSLKITHIPGAENVPFFRRE